MDVRNILLALASRIVSVEECWLNDNIDNINADLIIVRYSPTPIPNVNNERAPTLVFDLTAPEDQLWGEIGKTSRYKIRRAEREGAHFLGATDSNDQIPLLRWAHGQLRRRKPKSLLPLNMLFLRRLAVSHRLAITRCESADGETLSVHSYILVGKRALLLHSISLFDRSDSVDRRAFIARANRFHTWSDMRFFRNLAFSTFDMGGYYEGTTDPERLAVSYFKKDFGGRIETGYHAVVARTAWGHMIKRMTGR